MKTTIAISCLLMGASFGSLTPKIAHAAEDAGVDQVNADSQAEIDDAVPIAQTNEAVIAVAND